ncbi:MAG: CHAP domain-containing protein [Corynebacteriales bacterium]|nr:CHAP domain-containing protein [Mycobacteriales bacterium]
MWQRAGVDIPTLPLTGDLYRWGIAHGQAYSDKNLANDMHVGDALLFGTGPQTRFTSTHVGIVSRFDENSVTLIEGNAILPGQSRKDPHRVTEKTYPRDAWKKEFYGGVRPSNPSR